MLQRTARVCITALEVLHATTKLARKFHKFLGLMTKEVTGNKEVTNNSEANSAKKTVLVKIKGFFFTAKQI